MSGSYYVSFGITTHMGVNATNWIAKKADLAAGMWVEIEERCKAVGEIVARLSCRG